MVMAGDKWLCGNPNVLFPPEKNAEEYCKFRKYDHEKCLDEFSSEQEMFNNGKCLPITIKDFVRQSKKYKQGSCTCKLSIVQVDGKEYIVNAQCPCMTTSHMSFQENFDLLREEAKEIEEIYPKLPVELYP